MMDQPMRGQTDDGWWPFSVSESQNGVSARLMSCQRALQDIIFWKGVILKNAKEF